MRQPFRPLQVIKTSTGEEIILVFPVDNLATKVPVIQKDKPATTSLPRGSSRVISEDVKSRMGLGSHIWVGKSVLNGVRVCSEGRQW